MQISAGELQTPFQPRPLLFAEGYNGMPAGIKIGQSLKLFFHNQMQFGFWETLMDGLNETGRHHHISQPVGYANQNVAGVMAGYRH